MKLVSLFSAVAVSDAAASCRDVFLEPFNSDSIWNTAIGSDAVFAEIDLFHPDSATCGLPPCQPPTNFHNDQEFIIRGVPGMEGDKGVPWVHQGTWGGGDKCEVTGEVVSHLPIPNANCEIKIDGACAKYPSVSDSDWFNDRDMGGPAPSTESACSARASGWQADCGSEAQVHSRFTEGWTSTSDGGRSAPNQINNNPMGVLMPDGKSWVQMQPAYRCDPSGPFLARFGDQDGCPQTFPNVTDAFSDGNLGAHGGSGLSGVGGAIRSGELHLDAPAISHALKIELQHQWYYGDSRLQPSSDYNGGRGQYVWPATGSDSGSNKAPGGLYQGKNEHVVPGALLAIPSSQADGVTTTTVIGAKIKQALIDYGAYIVDDTGGGNSVAICMQSEVNAEMREQYGFAMTYPHGITSSASDAGHEVYEDLLRVFQALQAVTNNGPNSVGGGGTPRQPRKEPLCGQEEAVV